MSSKVLTRVGARGALAGVVASKDDIDQQCRIILAIVANDQMDPRLKEGMSNFTNRVAQRADVQKAIQEELAEFVNEYAELALTLQQEQAVEAVAEELDSDDDTLPDGNEDISDAILEGRVNRIFKETWKNRHFEALRSTVTLDSFIQNMFVNSRQFRFAPTVNTLEDRKLFYGVYGQLRTGVGSLKLCTQNLEHIFLENPIISTVAPQAAEESELKQRQSSAPEQSTQFLSNLGLWLSAKVQQASRGDIPLSELLKKRFTFISREEFVGVCLAIATVAVVVRQLTSLGFPSGPLYKLVSNVLLR